MNLVKEIVQFGKRQFRWRESELTDLTAVEKDIWERPMAEFPPHNLRRFTPRLSLLLLFKSIHGGTELQQVHNRINLQYALFRMLITFGALRLYGLLGEKMLPTVRRYAIVDIGVHITQILVKRYGGYEYDAQKLKRFKKLREEFRTELEMFYELDNYQLESARTLGRRRSLKQKIAWYDSLNPHVLDYNSSFNHPQIIWLQGLLKIRRYELSQDWDKLIACCNRSVVKLKSLPYHHRAALQSFTTHHARALVRSGKYSEAELLINKAATYYPDKKRNWIINRQLLFVTYMRQMKLSDAKALHDELSCLPHLKLYGSELRDRLYLYKMYVSLFDTDTDKLKVRRIINDIPQMERDLTGMNMALIIAELVHAVFSGDRDYILLRRSEIDTYVKRYCKDNVRSKCFVRLLLHLPLTDNAWHQWARYHNRMFAMMQQAVDTVEDIEIIDYEILWKHVASRYLEDNARYKFYKTESAPYTLAGL